MNAHFLVQYTGRLLTRRGKGEIFQNLVSLIPSQIPLLGQEISLLVFK